MRRAMPLGCWMTWYGRFSSRRDMFFVYAICAYWRVGRWDKGSGGRVRGCCTWARESGAGDAGLR